MFQNHDHFWSGQIETVFFVRVHETFSRIKDSRLIPAPSVRHDTGSNADKLKSKTVILFEIYHVWLC